MSQEYSNSVKKATANVVLVEKYQSFTRNDAKKNSYRTKKKVDSDQSGAGADHVYEPTLGGNRR